MSNSNRLTNKYLKLNNQLAQEYKLKKKISRGLSACNIFQVEKGRNYILKICPIKDSEIKELLVLLELNAKVGTKYFPKLYDYGFTDKKNPYTPTNADRDIYLYQVMEFIDGSTLKEAITERKISSTAAFKKIMKDAINAYADANEKTGLYHWDIKGDNIMVRKNGSPVIIDFGHSYTTRYNPKYWGKLKRELYTKLSKHYIPERDIRSRQFNKTPKNYRGRSKSLADKQLNKIKIEYVDIINLIKLINTGERMLFNGDEIILNDADINYFNNSYLPLYEKLDYLNGLF